MITISKYYKDDGEGHAEIISDIDCYDIFYYDKNGDKVFQESFPGKSLYYVEDAAENWALGIKKLDT